MKRVRMWARGDIEIIVSVSDEDAADEAKLHEIFEDAVLGAIDSGFNVEGDTNAAPGTELDEEP